MALTAMTPEWKRIADDIMIFVIRERKKNETRFQTVAQSPRTIFNLWVNTRGIAISSAELALWCVNYLRELASMPLRRLEKAAEIDKLTY